MHIPRHAYSGTNPVLLSCGPSRTKQSFKAECDINTIMARYMETGITDFVNKHAPQYADVSKIDFQSCMDQVVKAQAMFDDLPSNIRDRFQNNPAAFIDFMSNENNAPEMRTLGLLPAVTPAET